MKGLFNKSHIKDRNMQSTTSRYFIMHMLYQFQQETAILKINLCTHFWITFKKNGKYSFQIASHQAEMRREETITDKKSSNISSLQTDYLNLDSSSGFDRDSERAHAVQTQCTFCGGINHCAEQCFKRIRKEKEKARAFDVSSLSAL